uniref:Uncharacterized protein n=1 Tax=Knipowitschia caucasica TaxID=637954 RepID=A0AAV2LES6_KNICA
MPERRGGARRSEERAAKREAIRAHPDFHLQSQSLCAQRRRKYLPVDLNVRKMHSSTVRMSNLVQPKSAIGQTSELCVIVVVVQVREKKTSIFTHG